MSVPPLAPIAEEVYEQLAPLARLDQANSYVLAHLVAALNAPIEDTAAWISDDDEDRPGYSILLDVDRAPAIALPWLGQMKGVQVTPGVPEAEQREQIRTAEGFHRGTVPALIAAGQRHLTGAKTVRIIERAGTAYDLTAITRTSETPDPAVTLADLMSAKRIGIVLTHIVTDAPLIDEGTRVIDMGTATIDAATLADIT